MNVVVRLIILIIQLILFIVQPWLSLFILLHAYRAYLCFDGTFVCVSYPEIHLLLNPKRGNLSEVKSVFALNISPGFLLNSNTHTGLVSALLIVKTVGSRLSSGTDPTAGAKKSLFHT